MNKLAKFFHELLNPHCFHCLEAKEAAKEEARIERELERESRRCRSCESLERQLAVANEQINKLVNKLTEPEKFIVPVTPAEIPKPLRRTQIPFNVIRQQKEAESRAQADALKNAAKPDSQISQNNEAIQIITPGSNDNLDNLEQEVLNARTKRESETGTKTVSA